MVVHEGGKKYQKTKMKKQKVVYLETGRRERMCAKRT